MTTPKQSACVVLSTVFLAFLSSRALGQVPRAASGGRWEQSESKSPMDDSKTVTVSLPGDNTVSAWPNRVERPTLRIRCQEKETDVYVTTGLSANPERGDGITVRVRIDDDPAFVASWIESTSKESLFSERPIPLANRLNFASTLLFQFTPFNSSPVIVRFNLEGIQPRLKAVADACKWPVASSRKELDLSDRILATNIQPAPFEFNGLILPIPKFAEPRPSGSPNTAAFFAVTLNSTKDFFDAAMELYGFSLDPSEPSCWIRSINGKPYKACVDLRQESRISITVTTP